MKNILLGIIAINLTFISANLALRSVEPVQAQSQMICEQIYLRTESMMEDNLNKNCPICNAIPITSDSSYYQAFCK